MDIRNRNKEDIFLTDNAITHNIFNNEKYFAYLSIREANVNIIICNAKMIEGSGRANIILQQGTIITIGDALFSLKSPRNLLSFKDIRSNGYHIETTNDGNTNYLNITKMISGKKSFLEKLYVLSSGLYYTNITMIHAIGNKKGMIIPSKFDMTDWAIPDKLLCAKN